MTTTLSRPLSKWLAVALLTFGTPLASEGQRTGPRQPAAAPWPSITIGAKAGYDNNANAELLGAQLRVPLLRNGSLELMPSADVTFVTGLREYQYSVEALYILGGPRGGPYVGGGLAFRNTIYGREASIPRETRRGYSIIVGSKFGAQTNFGVQLEVRWVFISEAVSDEVSPVDPQVVTLGINIPLTGRGNHPAGPGS